MEFDPVEYIHLKDKNLLYLVISKSACTSIKATLGKSYGIFSNLDSGIDIHKNENWTRIFGKVPFGLNECMAFTVVRNPFTRIVSCYLDKVLHEKEKSEEFYYEKYPYSIHPNMSFSDFVKVICSIPDRFADRHFKSQQYTISRYRKPLKYVLKVEYLENDWKKLAGTFQLETELENKNIGKGESSEKEELYFNYYDLNTLEKINKRYKKDIVHFDYQEEYLKLKEFIENRKSVSL